VLMQHMGKPDSLFILNLCGIVLPSRDEGNSACH
jgi:hypothetical protein